MRRALRVLSLFSGMGAFEKALERMGCPHEVVGWSEVDEAACKAWRAIHGDAPALGDVRDLDATGLDADLVTFGFPCQDISLAGHMAGFGEGGETRSALFFEAMRVIAECRPAAAVAENVANLMSDRMLPVRRLVADGIAEAGYEQYWCVLDARRFGVPQTRRRVFIVCIRSDLARGFAFPEGRDLDKSLADLLQPNDAIAADKWLTEEQLAKVRPEGEPAGSLRFKTANRQGWEEAEPGDSVSLSYPNSESKRGRVKHGLAPTLATVTNEAVVVGGASGPRVRRLTPLEAVRLMGFDDADYEAMAEAGMTETQIFKCCGNSIVVPVAEALLWELLDQYAEELADD